MIIRSANIQGRWQGVFNFEVTIGLTEQYCLLSLLDQVASKELRFSYTMRKT
jgi:hypothetical protein